MVVDQDTVLEPRPVILIVDDSRVMRQALKKILTPLYAVAEAGDGEDGWAQVLSQRAIAGVFTDLSMPRLDGYGLIRRIRESGDGRISKLPILLITGNEDSAGTRERALAAGATGVIMKPFNAQDVLGVAQQHVQLPAPKPKPSPAPAAPPPALPVASADAAEAAALRARVTELETTLRDVRSQLKSWQDEMRKAEAASVSANAEWEQTVELTRRQLREAMSERDRAKGELERLRTELILRQQSVDEQRVTERLREMEAQLKEAREGQKSAQEAATRFGVERQRLEDEMSARISALEARVKQSNEAEQSAREALARSLAERERMAATLGRAGSLETELEQARTELAGATKELEVLRLSQGRTGSMEAELRDLRAQLTSAQRELEGLREARDRAGSLESQLQEARSSLASTSEELAELRTALERVEDERTTLRAYLASEQDARAGLEERLDVLQEGLTEREQAMADSESRREDLERAANQMRERAERAEQAMERLEREAREVAEQEASEEDYQAMLAALRTRAENAELSQLQLEDELVETAAKLERSDHARETAERELRNLMRELADARRSIRQLQTAAQAATRPSVEAPRPAAEPVQVEQKPQARPWPEPVLERTLEDDDSLVSFSMDDEREPAKPTAEAKGVEVGEAASASREKDAGRSGFMPDSLIRQWEEQRRRQRRMQVAAVVAMAVIMALVFYFILT
ncbi:response regulator [Thioalkalivibrio sulfidiphilus]|uniref:response regulator n=1 Tax=Thioalkalivibrio sulfidiphilus TaxID=1033854 RepID=UPI00037FC940|nr:response regulator [Thioalkalivibrio sulfidiphilus]